MSDQTGRKWKTKKKRSLAEKVTVMSVAGALTIGFVGLLFGLYIYAGNLFDKFVSDTFELTGTARQVSMNFAEPESLAAEVVRIYRGLSEEERSGTGSDAYHDCFGKITESGDYQTLYKVLHDFSVLNDVDDVYFAVYDRDTSALIYIVDPDTRNRYIKGPGDWEKVDNKELNIFLGWDGTGIPHYSYIGGQDPWVCTVGVPVGDESNGTRGYILADFTLNEMTHDMLAFLIRYIFATIAVTAFMGFIITRLMERTTVRPINAIAKAAQSYVEDRRSGNTRMEHFSSLPIRTGDEVEHLNRVMAQMEKDLSVYMEDLTRVTKKEERVRTELDMASKIQKGALPDIFPAFPDRQEFDLYASMEPAKEIGGDFYDFFLIDDDHLCLVIADVSGKGVPAALFMMASKIILADNAIMGKSPSEILYDANNAICKNNKLEMFVTVWVGILEISTGKLSAANAGHEYPALKRGDGGFSVFKDRHGFVLGGMEGMKYKEYEIQLSPGDKLFVYTDGVPEANDPDGNMFEVKRMIDALNEDPDASPAQILGAVRGEISKFVREAEQFDDLTMLCLEYKGANKDP
jgi:sigma-B regulation protein RsbU (phosphoserine phosphatase)